MLPLPAALSLLRPPASWFVFGLPTPGDRNGHRGGERGVEQKELLASKAADQRLFLV